MREHVWHDMDKICAPCVQSTLWRHITPLAAKVSTLQNKPELRPKEALQRFILHALWIYVSMGPIASTQTNFTTFLYEQTLRCVFLLPCFRQLTRFRNTAQIHLTLIAFLDPWST
jgi:hypothetical protein